MNTFQVKAAWRQGKPLLFRDRKFKKERYVVFAEDHSFQFFTFREYASYVAASYGRKLSDIDGGYLRQGVHTGQREDGA